MKMREFMNALDNTVDLTEAQEKITESLSLGEEDEISVAWEQSVAAANRLRSFLQRFMRTIEQTQPNMSESERDHWQHAAFDAEEIIKALNDSNLR